MISVKISITKKKPIPIKSIPPIFNIGGNIGSSIGQPLRIIFVKHIRYNTYTTRPSMNGQTNGR